MEAAPGNQLLDQDGSVGLPPEVEDRHDLWRVELGDRPRLCFESPDEGWVIGHFGPDHLDRDLSADGGLIGAVHVPVPGLPKARSQLVSAHCQARIGPALGSTTRHRLQSGITCEDLLFQVAQIGRRFDTQLRPQTFPELAIGTECLGLAAGPIKRGHEQCGELLPIGVFTHQTFELAHQLMSQPTGEVGLHAALDGIETQ